MMDGCDQKPEGRRDESSSDDDSVSLLHGLDSMGLREAAEEMEIRDGHSQAGNREQGHVTMMNQLKPPNSEACRSSEGATGCQSTKTQSAKKMVKKVQKMVKIPNKTKLHKRNEWGETLLHQACKRGDLPTVTALIQAGISINVADNAGWTPLHEAAAVGNAAVVEEMLTAGANANAISFAGTIPLHVAVTEGHYEVAKLLLQFGSNLSDLTGDSLSALDVTENDHIRELLLTFRASTPAEENSWVASAPQHTGCKSSEAPCHPQLSCQKSFSPNVRSRESDDGARAREPADIQPREGHTNTQNLTHPEDLKRYLEELRRKQTEISLWPLEAPPDADRYRAALSNIQTQLMEVLDRQHLDKEHISRKRWSVSNSLWQHVLKSRLVPLASRQKILVEILHKQMHLVEVYMAKKAKLSTQPPNHQPASVRRPQSHHVSFPVSAPARGRPRLSRARLLSGVVRSSRPSALSNHTPWLIKTTSECRSSSNPTVSTAHHNNTKVMRKNAAIKTTDGDNTRCLSELLQRGILKPGSSLLFLKGQWCRAHVLPDGSLQDLQSRIFATPECWLEFVLKKRPVSSAFAWDKVMLQNKPLSSYTVNLDAEDTAQRCTDSSAGDLTLEGASLRLLRRVKIIRLVGIDELLPNTLMDLYWDKLKDDGSDSDWNNL